ncbi:DUF2777 family protein [Bacillus solitudinis]|uniref:DUF2777 family protein n=1 Tax=Bacillus solitudinis TaxID=2014074 RepID=UPI0012FD9B11|nr:DUF2777 family protein [Bacillus solitudinis]
MDRKQAQNVIGQLILLDEGSEGRYIGELLEVVTEPRKPWRGKVKIKALQSFPDSLREEDRVVIRDPLYLENQLVECSGSKLTPYESEECPSYSASLLVSVDRRTQQLHDQTKKGNDEIKALHSFLYKKGLGEETPIVENESDTNYIEYTFHRKKGRYYLVDKHGEQLDLKECPFEFIWEIGLEKQTGYYIGDGSFETENGQRFSPNENDVLFIDKKQFDPYFILRNELEPTALESLEKSLTTHQLTHDDLTHCHNSLLSQLLYSEGRSSFKGVNFLTFKGKQGMVMVQHHYDRTLVEEANDEIYDRFEFTTEFGKRSIVTYTNEFSK